MNCPRCPVCGRDFNSQQALIQHTESKHGRDGVYKGVLCWENSRRQNGELTTGVEDRTYKYDIDNACYDGRRKAWCCSVCDHPFPKKLHLQEHFQSGVHESPRYRCDGCRKTFVSLSALKMHLKSTNCSDRSDRLIDTMVKDVENQRLMITNGTPTTFYEATLWFDGSASPNPGAGGGGIILVDFRGKEVLRQSFSVANIREFGDVSSNQAEYSALVHGMKMALSNKILKLLVKGDSELVIKQMNGYYRVDSERIIPYYKAAVHLRKQFLELKFEHISREDNQIADKLSKDGCKWLDGGPYSTRLSDLLEGF